MLVHWQQTFELGQPLADAEHREVVDLLNAMDAFLADDSPPSTITDTLDSLIHTLARHFAQEHTSPRQILERARQLHHAYCHDAEMPNRDDIRSLAHGWLLHLCRHVHGAAEVAP